VKRTLATGPKPTSISRRYPRYHQFTDPAERRLAIIRLHAEGWNVKSIAGYLETTRRRVYVTLRRWVEEGVRGRDDKPHRRKKLVFKTDVEAIAAIRKLIPMRDEIMFDNFPHTRDKRRPLHYV
jgi:hypothetical protein